MNANQVSKLLNNSAKLLEDMESYNDEYEQINSISDVSTEDLQALIDACGGLWKDSDGELYLGCELEDDEDNIDDM